MKVLLDTHIILWALIDHPSLSKQAREIILNPDNTVFYSTVSPWEIEIKHLKDKSFMFSGEQLCFLCDQNGLLNLPIQNEHVKELKNLKNHKHRDPFDRMLIAQARCEKMMLITSDSKFKDYKDENVLVV